jgi:ribosomal protein S27AE
MNNIQEPILSRTHQAWKYKASFAICWLAIIIFSVSLYNISSHPEWHIPGLMVAGIFFISGFIIAFNIKCPNCGSRWYWLALRESLKKPLLEDGFVKMRLQKVCPICGFSGDDRSE